VQHLILGNANHLADLLNMATSYIEW